MALGWVSWLQTLCGGDVLGAIDVTCAAAGAILMLFEPNRYCDITQCINVALGGLDLSAWLVDDVAGNGGRWLGHAAMHTLAID